MNIESLKLAVIGINHKCSTVDDREKFQVTKHEMPGSLQYIRAQKSVEGVIIISTCNRIEFYLSLANGTDPYDVVADYYTTMKSINSENIRDMFYIHHRKAAAIHLFHVISGLDSMLLGEYQIKGQVKESFSSACAEETADRVLKKLFHAAFRVSKKVRNQTKIGSGRQSLSGVASEIINESINKNDIITIIGVNQSTRIIAEKLKYSGYTNLIFVNRTFYKAEKMAKRFSGTAVKLENIEEALLKSQCVFSSTGSPSYVIKAGTLRRIFTYSSFLSLIIDMAIPRDIETSDMPEFVKVYDLEGLKDYLQEQREKNAEDFPIAEKIIAEEVRLFEVWNESQNDEIFKSYAEKLETLRMQLLEENRMKLTEDEFKLMEKFSHSLIHRTKATFIQAIKMHKVKEMAKV